MYLSVRDKALRALTLSNCQGTYRYTQIFWGSQRIPHDPARLSMP